MSFPSKTIEPLVRWPQPGDHVEKRCLPGSVGADQSEDLSSLHFHGDVAQRDDAGEGHAYSLHLEAGPECRRRATRNRLVGLRHRTPTAATAGLCCIDFTFPLSPTVPTAARTIALDFGTSQTIGQAPSRCRRTCSLSRKTTCRVAVIVVRPPLPTPRSTPSSRVFFAIMTGSFTFADSRTGWSRHSGSASSSRPTYPRIGPRETLNDRHSAGSGRPRARRGPSPPRTR